MRKYIWVIERYDGTKLIAQYTIPHGEITEENINNLLRTLAAKHELTDEEIIPCFLKRNAKNIGITWKYNTTARLNFILCIVRARWKLQRYACQRKDFLKFLMILCRSNECSKASTPNLCLNCLDGGRDVFWDRKGCDQFSLL